MVSSRAATHALLVASLFTCAAACAGSGKKKPGGPDETAGDDQLEDPESAGALSVGPGENIPSVIFGDSADANWKLGEEAFAEEDYLAAQRYYSHVRTKFPYSQYAALSDLRIGDCQFERGRHIEAIDSYQSFIRLHPTHDRVPYALYRQGLSYYEQIPGDWFMLPPSEEKEQTAVRDAERTLRDYVERFPKDDHIADGKERLTEVRKKLLAHERYVADFYQRRGKDRAYVGRLQVIRKSFADVGLDDTLLAEIVGAYSRLGEITGAKAALAELEQKFPASRLIAEARAAVAQATPAEPPPPERAREGEAPRAPGEGGEDLGSEPGKPDGAPEEPAEPGSERDG